LLAAAVTIAASVWALVIVATPFAAARGSLPWAVLFVYQLGALVCHQRPERSFHLDGVTMPVCARCFGLYAAGAAGLLLAWAVRGILVNKGSRGHVAAVLAAAAAPIALSVALEWIGAMTTTNVFRALTGLPLGLAAGVLIVAVLQEARGGERNRSWTPKAPDRPDMIAGNGQ
jgi:uncharacterized membrane protein